MCLSVRADGRWAARQFGLIVPRQNGKGAFLEALELYHLRHVESTRLIIHSAHKQDTAYDAMERLLGRIDDCPDIKRLLAPNGVKKSHGQESITFRDGREVKFRTRTGGGGRGFSGDLVVLDEAYNVPPRMIAALIPTMSAMPNPLLVITSSHPFAASSELEGPRSAFLRQVMRRGRTGTDPLLSYMEYRAPDGSDRHDPEARRAANPGYPVHIDDEAIDGEIALDVTDMADLDRERFGIVDISEEDENGWLVIDRERWLATHDPKSKATGKLVLAMDVAPDQVWTSFAIAGATATGVHIGSPPKLPGTDRAVAECQSLLEKHPELERFVVMAKNGPGYFLKPKLEEAGVTVREVGNEEFAQATGDLLAALAEPGAVRQKPNDEVTAAAKAAVTRQYGESALLTRSKSTGDISPLVAGTLARWVHLHDHAEELSLCAY